MFYIVNTSYFLEVFFYFFRKGGIWKWKEIGKKATICVQGGYNPKAGEPRVLPIYQSTTYKYDDPGRLADIFDLKKEGHMYSRISNPTVAAFEEKK